MLIQFTVGNFKSFKEKSTLSLEATTDTWLEEDNIATEEKHRLVRVAAIYGANAGGKSNFLKALAKFRQWITNSSKDAQAEEKIPIEPFKFHTETENAPSFFEIVFLTDGARYRYGFEATPEEISGEWLFRQKDSIRETRLFTREHNRIHISSSFKEGKGLEQRTRINALFLSVVAQFNGEIAGEIFRWLNKCRDISGLNDEHYMSFTAKKMQENEYGPLISELTKRADVGIEDIKVFDVAREEFIKQFPKTFPASLRSAVSEMMNSATSSARTVKTYHKKYNAKNEVEGLVEMNFGGESAGTQKFVALTGPVLEALKEGGVLFVDELEARLHPKLTAALLALFNSSSNTKKAQLVFATHDNSSMNFKKIRRDQIWFVEKDSIGASRLYGLKGFPIRKHSKFDKEYLSGQFGAVPKVEDFKGILGHEKN